MNECGVIAGNDKVAPKATMAFHLHTHPVRMVSSAARRWFIASDVVRIVGSVGLHSIRQCVPLNHQREMALCLPEGGLRMLVFSEQGLELVLAQRRTALAVGFLAKVATLP
ncbi:prophage antirepressor-like protein [Dyella japonica]|uniref:Prophage antirepressor-like protein n=1 Tax=Dyella japonica TaxID=231455 RepID=A0ABV2K132_9GAMM